MTNKTNNRIFSYNRGIRYGDNIYPSSDATLVDENGQQWQGPTFADANSQYYTMQNGKAVPVMPVHTLDEVSVTAPKKHKTASDYFGDYLTMSNDATKVFNTPHRDYNTHLAERAIRGAQSHAAWEQEHPNLAAWSYAAGAAPFAVASAPLVAGVGDALAGTALGQGITNGLGIVANAASNSTWLPWVDAAATSYFGTHGLQEMANGNFTPETALEVAPLMQMAKPMYNAGKEVASFINKADSPTEVYNVLLNANDATNNGKLGNESIFKFKEDPLNMHYARAKAKGYDPSTVKIYDLSQASNENTQLIKDLAKQYNIPPEQVTKELMTHLNTHGHAGAYPGAGIVVHDGKMSNKSIVLSHEFDHALHIPDTPLPDEVFYPRVKRIHGNYFTRDNNTEVAARGSQIHDYFGHTGNEPITAENLQYAKKHYVRDTGIDNLMHDFLWSIKDEHLSIVADWMTRNSTGIIPLGIAGNSLYQSNN